MMYDKYIMCAYIIIYVHNCIHTMYSPLPGPASPIMKDNPVDCSGDVDPTHQDHITTVDNSQSV